jgi:hypothetical protein
MEDAQEQFLEAENFKLRQVWPGNNVACYTFCLCGPNPGDKHIFLLICPPSCFDRLCIGSGILAFTLMVLLGLNAAFALILWDFYDIGGVQWIVLGVSWSVIFVTSLSYMLRASFTDAGIIPRHRPPSAPPVVCNIDNSLQHFAAEGPMTPADIAADPMYCKTCCILRPPFAKHCRECDNCVEQFDHHCGWLSNCIGRRNFKYFLGFVVSTALLDVFVAAVTALVLYRRFPGDSGSGQMEAVRSLLSEQSLASGLLIASLVWGYFLVNLSVYHVRRTVRRIELLDEAKASGHPHSLASWCLAPVAPSRFSLDDVVDASGRRLHSYTVRPGSAPPLRHCRRATKYAVCSSTLTGPPARQQHVRVAWLPPPQEPRECSARPAGPQSHPARASPCILHSSLCTLICIAPHTLHDRPRSPPPPSASLSQPLSGRRLPAVGCRRDLHLPGGS